MKKLSWKYVSVLVAVMGLSQGLQVSFAHEGHGAPGTVQPEHAGGVIKTGKEFYLELVQKGPSIQLFPTTHEKQSIQASEIRVSATTQLPRAKKKEKLLLTDANDAAQPHFEGKFDAKGAHRYALVVEVEYKGKKQSIVFQVEPKP